MGLIGDRKFSHRKHSFPASCSEQGPWYLQKIDAVACA